MNLSYREKSLWVSLLGSVLVAAYFSDSVWAHLVAGPSAQTTTIGTLVLQAVIAMVVLEAVLHGLLAMDDQEGADEPEDEREKLIRFKANEYGYWVLAIGVISCILQQLVNGQLASHGLDVSDQQPFAAIAYGAIELKLVVVFWVSEMVRFAAQIYHYRREDTE